MTEIQFLVKIMLDETASNEIKTKCAQRIDELEQLRASQTIFQPLTYTVPNLIMPLPYIGPNSGTLVVDTCQHEYPTMWGGVAPPPCTKCGKQLNTNGGIFSNQTNQTVAAKVGDFYAGGCPGFGGASNHISLAK